MGPALYPHIVEKLKAKEYDSFIGIDPGLKIMFGAVKKPCGSNTLENMLLSGKAYHNEAGARLRRHNFFKWTKGIRDRTLRYRSTRKNRQGEEIEISPLNVHWKEFVEYKLTFFNRLQKQYSQHKVTRLKFKKYISSQKADVKVLREFIEPKEKALVFMGITPFPSNSPMRGHQRVPHARFRKLLSQHADVVDVDEFRSTMLCSRCFMPAKTFRSPHRFQTCGRCGVVWHRDINAAHNILKLGMAYLENRTLHGNFLRGHEVVVEDQNPNDQDLSDSDSND